MKCLFALTLGISIAAQATDLTIESNGKTQTLSSAELLKRGTDLHFPSDPTYTKPPVYRVVPLKDLFKDQIPSKESSLLFEALDGFRVAIPAEHLFYTKGLEPVLAIEDSEKPWPNIKKKSASAGPYYLMWPGDVAAKKIGQEEWPFMVVKIIVQKSLAEEYPAIVPKVKLASNVYKGYELFTKHCFACHALNGSGGEKMGPDLGIPYSPTDYLRKEYFKKLIRSPQSLRKWPGSQMSSFTAEAISDSQIDQIWEYLKFI